MALNSPRQDRKCISCFIVTTNMCANTDYKSNLVTEISVWIR